MGLSKLPTPKDVENLAEKASLLDPAANKCILFTRMWNTKVKDENEDITSSTRTKFNDTDLKYAFELMSLLETSKTVPGRTFNNSFVYSQRANVTTDIKDKKVEDRMKEQTSDAAAKIMSTLRQCYDKNRTTATQIIVTEEANAQGETVEVEKEVEVEVEEQEAEANLIDEDALRSELVNSDKLDGEVDEMGNQEEEDEEDEQNNGVYQSAVMDVWTRGRQLVEKDNVREMRKGQAARLQRKKLKNHALRMHIQWKQANIGNCSLKDECPTSQQIHPSYYTVLNKYVKK